MSPDIRRRKPLREHKDLQVVKQLGDLGSRFVVRLELCGHPHFGGLLHDLLADLVNACVKLGDRRGAGGACCRLGAQLGEEFVEGFHPYSVSAVAEGQLRYATPSRSITKVSVRPESR